MNHSYQSQAGMYKVAILYPNEENVTFDMEYYEQKHMPMVAAFLGDNLQFYEIDKAISGRKPTDKPPFVTIGYFYVKDVEEYDKALAPHRDVIMADIKKYTNVQPIVTISLIKKMASR